MKYSIWFYGIVFFILLSCNMDRSFVVGEWTIDNLSSSDTSVNKETLLATSLARHYAAKNVMIFRIDNSITLTNSEGKVLDEGDYKLVDGGNYLTIEFSKDKMESKYTISERAENSFKLSASDAGESINIVLSRQKR